MKNYSLLIFAFLFAASGCSTETNSASSVDPVQATESKSTKTSKAVYSPMSTGSPQAAEVRAEIDNLIKQVNEGNMEILDAIYHPDMSINMFSPALELTVLDKPAFISQLKSMVKDAAAQPSTWANFHKVEANETAGHVLISRKISDEDDQPQLTLSIDLVKENDRWLITREVIFMHR